MSLQGLLARQNPPLLLREHLDHILKAAMQCYCTLHMTERTRTGLETRAYAEAARRIMNFANMIADHVSGDTLIQLNRMEVMIT